MSNSVKSWSWSALSLYETCPAKYKYEKIDKLPSPKGPAMARGIEVHNQCDKYLTGQLEFMPEVCKNFEKEFIELKSLDPFTEQEWAFKADWSDTHWRDWKKCWLRCKIDAGVPYADQTGDIIDFKTGKVGSDYDAQLNLFATTFFHKFRGAKEVKTRLWYLDSGDETPPVTFYRKDLANMVGAWEERIQPLFNDTIFAPKPNKFCNWCHFRKSNGGPCRHS